MRKSYGFDDYDGSPTRSDRRHSSPYMTSTHLPKLKLKSFDGNALDWPEWSSMFLATVHSQRIADSEKMSPAKSGLQLRVGGQTDSTVGAVGTGPHTADLHETGVGYPSPPLTHKNHQRLRGKKGCSQAARTSVPTADGLHWHRRCWRRKLCPVRGTDHP